MGIVGRGELRARTFCAAAKKVLRLHCSRTSDCTIWYTLMDKRIQIGRANVCTQDTTDAGSVGPGDSLCFSSSALARFSARPRACRFASGGAYRSAAFCTNSPACRTAAIGGGALSCSRTTLSGRRQVRRGGTAFAPERLRYSSRSGGRHLMLVLVLSLFVVLLSFRASLRGGSAARGCF